MKRLMLGCILSFALACAPFSASANSVAAPSKAANWLEILNFYRSSSGLAPVSEDPLMSDAAQKHAKYLAKTDKKYFVNEYANLHIENPESPYSSEFGATLGAGDIAWTSTYSQRPIDQLMSAPFHAIGLLHEALIRVGFGTAAVGSNGFMPGHQVSNIAINAGITTTPRTLNIFFPGANATVSINDFHSENPEPREACGSDYKKYQGLPIFVSLLNSPSVWTSAYLTTPAGKVLSSAKDLCVVTEHNFISTDPTYGDAGRYIVADKHLILVIPREPLKVGTYGVVIKQKNLADLSWKFTYADTFKKVENKVTIIYPRINKVLYVGDTAKIRVMSIDAGASAHTSGKAACISKWHGNELWVTGKSIGTCTVNVSGGTSMDTKAYKKIVTFNYLAKKS